jgi:translation elongation factor EF-Ts
VSDEGRAHTYCHHNGRIGVVVHVRCDTDFCARSGEFLAWCDDIAMQIAATNPANVAELLAQAYVKDAARTVAQHVNALRNMVGETIAVVRFARLDLDSQEEGGT